MSRNLDMSFWMLLAGTSLLALVMAIKDPGLLAPSLQRSAYLLAGVLPELLLGFLIAGLLEVLIPQPTLMRWLGEQNAGYGILAGWVIGLLVPGGPYLLFPLVANLLKQGAAPGPLIALLTAKILLSPIRMVSYEAPSVGWPLTLARFIPSLFLPPVVAWAGQWLFQILRK
jgi:uncharacterized membrane protein YraQ (UPF0718 family)